MIPNGNSDPDKGVLEKITMWVNIKDAGFLIFMFHLKTTDYIEQEEKYIVGFISSSKVKQKKVGAMKVHHCKVLTL